MVRYCTIKFAKLEQNFHWYEGSSDVPAPGDHGQQSLNGLVCFKCCHTKPFYTSMKLLLASRINSLSPPFGRAVPKVSRDFRRRPLWGLLELLHPRQCAEPVEPPEGQEKAAAPPPLPAAPTGASAPLLSPRGRSESQLST